MHIVRRANAQRPAARRMRLLRGVCQLMRQQLRAARRAGPEQSGAEDDIVPHRIGIGANGAGGGVGQRAVMDAHLAEIMPQLGLEFFAHHWVQPAARLRQRLMHQRRCRLAFRRPPTGHALRPQGVFRAFHAFAREPGLAAAIAAALHQLQRRARA
jgi:hypothetical protein